MKQPIFIWTHDYHNCDQCKECVDTCHALRLTTLNRIQRDEKLCTRCECCSTICNNITTNFE